MKRLRIRIQKIVTVLLVITLICCGLPCERINATEEEHRTIRVGDYPVASYQEVLEDGSYSGFSYDYFMQIQKYTRWDYEFVEASYADCLQMLLNGEIDVMSGLTETDTRKEQLIFSKYSISNTQNKLYARQDSDRLFYESYDTFDGCKVAVLTGMVSGELDQYCERHDFNIEKVEYKTPGEVEAALLQGEVDMAYAASLSENIDTKIVARLEKIPLYYAVNKNEPEIAEELDDALQKIIDNNPNFYTQMSEKYMISGANATATFTREELEYIQSGQTVYVIMNEDWAPISWYDEESKSFKGIFVDILDKMKEYNGLQFELCSEEEFDKMAEKDPDMINRVLAILADDNSWAVQQKVMMTNHVVDASVVMVTKRGIHKEDLKEDIRIALPNRFYIGYVMRNELAGKNVVYYDTVQECLDAVNNGKADATYVNELVATYYLSMLEYSELFATGNSGYFENLSFAVNKDSKEPLLSIIDKSLLCIGTNEIDQIVIQNSIADERFSWKGLYYSNPVLTTTSIVSFVLIVFAIIVSIQNTIEKKKKAEAELQKEFETSNARTEFFMMISHELRTPLNAIVGYLDCVAEQCSKNHEDMEYIRRSQNAARQLTDISEDMLDYTKISSNSVELKEELFDLKEVISFVDENVSLRAREKNLEYHFRVQNMIHEYVIGDRLRLEQVMQNILSNAVKFTPDEGVVEVELSEKSIDCGKVEITFICKDTGKGMTKEFLDKICAPFNQSDKSYSRTHGGLGLGLYLTKFFVNAMNGTLTVESKLGEGSCFTVVIPLQRPNSEQIMENQVDCSHVRAIIAGKDEKDNV